MEEGRKPPSGRLLWALRALWATILMRLDLFWVIDRGVAPGRCGYAAVGDPRDKNALARGASTSNPYTYLQVF